MKQSSIILIILLLSSTFAMSQGKNTFSDSFTDNRNAWWEGQAPLGACVLADGNYTITYIGKKSWSPTIAIPLDENGDFTIRSSMTRLSGTNANGYGLIWGKGKSGYYNFIVTGAGKFYVRKVETNKKGRYLIAWQKSKHINKGNKSNRLEIQKKGNRWLFLVNGQLLAQIAAEPFFGDQTGFMLYQQQQVEVADLDVFSSSSKQVFANSSDLRIEKFTINDSDGNNNAMIDAGETIEVTAYVQNFGKVDASDVKAKAYLTSKNKHISFPERDRVFDLQSVASGHYQTLRFSFFTSKRFQDKEIDFLIKLKEKSNSNRKSIAIHLPVGKLLPQSQAAEAIVESSEVVNMQTIDDFQSMSDIDKNIPKTRVDGSNTLVIVFGIEQYKYAPKVTYATRDAIVFRQYMLQTFGVPNENIFYRTNQDASLGEFKKIFAPNGWLARRIEKNKTKVIVYYAGHGVPDTKSKQAFIVPYDIDPNYATTGFALDEMYRSLSQLEAKSVLVLLDACFSGINRSAEMLVDDARGLIVKPKSSKVGNKITVLSASQADQYSTFYAEKGHGLFTYFLLKKIQQAAKNRKRSLSITDLYNYIKTNVKKQAGRQDKIQIPTLDGDKSLILGL